MSKLIVDQHDRHKIEQCLMSTFLVEAGAGSGKTTSLVNRMVNLIRTGTYQMKELAAITFTKKAAEELTTRFQIKLEEAWKKEENDNNRKCLDQALKNFDQCFLGTVHSFCAQLLRERPIEAGLDLSFREIEESDDNELALLAWNTYVEQLQMNDPKYYNQVIQLGVPITDLQTSFLQMKSFPDVDWVFETKQEPELNEIFQLFVQLILEAKHAIPTQPIDGKYDGLQEIILQAYRKITFGNLTRNAQKIEIFELFNKKLTIVQKLWTSKEDAKYYLGKVSDFFESTIQPILLAWYEYVHGVIIPLMKNVMNQYEFIKRQGSYVNFHDLLMKTAKLLKEKSEVRKYFQNKYRCLLIDEFQDTDPIQAEIMFYLTSDNLYEQDWTKCKPRSGSLFIVGDPKQAIYRFRRADINIYNKVKELILLHGGEVLELTMNFRTLDIVTQKLNEVFKRKLPTVESDYQAAFKPLHSYFVDKDSPFSGVHQLVTPENYSKKEAIIQFDSEQIALTIRNMIQQGFHPNEFMVLTRYNEDLDIYFQALLNKDIPAVISGEITLGKMVEFEDLYHLCEFILEPGNPVQLLSILRGCFFGISDQQLFDWKQAGGMFSIYSHIPTKIDKQTKQSMSSIFNRLRSYVEWKSVLSPGALFEKIVDDIGFFPLLHLSGYGNKEAQYVSQILDRIRPLTTFKEAVSQLKNDIFSSIQMGNVEGTDHAVRVMNVHKSKGLEARVVFLANPFKKVDMSKRITYHIKRSDSGMKGYFILTKRNGFSNKLVAQPALWEEFQAIENKYLTEEETRIVYVAATRAEHTLFISTCQKNNKKNPWQELVDIIKPTVMESVVKKKNEEIDYKLNQEIASNVEIKLENEMWVTKLSNDSFNVYSPTNDKHDYYRLTIEREEGGGLAWGTMIHVVFERFVKGKGINVEHQLDVILKEHGIPIDRCEEVLSLVHQFKQSDIWRQLKQSEQILTEVPFMLKIEAEDPLYQIIGVKEKGKQPFIVKGVIDLAYQYNENWIIVDYKTDRPKEKRELSSLAAYYQHQITFYKAAWERITGSKVEYSLLYFVAFDEIYEI
ncbi:UvrD-helicase domain-containing protein [Heyndrickxia vini]|uniref:DNA 3'-5' helicase n=1 Tax=Heyndrickxia vini TaxID=1476025 RepID=A0ABX7DXF3_9BACI|nr:UvrD-helicase domain-containing protein [Heyndrickxia vini]QQZ07798.1 UvrD-helicase domain-containing protein [Heyndrickxia vini]